MSEKIENKSTNTVMNCPKCKEQHPAKKTKIGSSSHNVRYTCEGCKHSWVMNLGGGFDPSQL